MPAGAFWQMRKEHSVALLEHMQNRGVQALFLGDKLSNIRSLARLKAQYSPEMYQFFHQKNPNAHHWYYRSMANALMALSDTPEWQKLDALIRTTFEEE